MLPVAAPLTTALPPTVQPQLDAIRRDNAKFEPIPQPTGAGAGSRTRAEADDYDRNRSGLETKDAANRTELARTDGNSQNPSAQASRNDGNARVDPDGRNNPNNPQQDTRQNGQQNSRDRQQERQVQAQVSELKGRDREVRAHEAAHAAVGGQYAGAPVFQYQKGPDGRRYAVGGEVSIDASPVPDNPQATIRKLETVRAAALAPADPSPQDRQVAARATALIAEARRQLAVQLREESATGGASNAGKVRLASDSASEAVFGADGELASPTDSGLTVYPNAPLRSPCPMCSKPHLSPVSSSNLASNFSLTDRLRSLGVTDYSARDFRASA
ncbi:MAG TPA: putative metalloprotease CJM1_0395 family protein [Permianibacter sp.]|nr:putative metalloprotease CJM1_0395 family protein [Permianibacter sp.]